MTSSCDIKKKAAPNMGAVLASNMRFLRRLYDLSQETVAELVGLSRTCYCAYECGSKMPALETVYALSRLYNISLDLLMTHDLSDFAIAVIDIIRDGGSLTCAEEYMQPAENRMTKSNMQLTENNGNEMKKSSYLMSTGQRTHK